MASSEFITRARKRLQVKIKLAQEESPIEPNYTKMEEDALDDMQ